MENNTKNFIKEFAYTTSLILTAYAAGAAVGAFFNKVIRPVMFKEK